MSLSILLLIEPPFFESFLFHHLSYCVAVISSLSKDTVFFAGSYWLLNTPSRQGLYVLHRCDKVPNKNHLVEKGLVQLLLERTVYFRGRHSGRSMRPLVESHSHAGSRLCRLRVSIAVEKPP